MRERLTNQREGSLAQAVGQLLPLLDRVFPTAIGAVLREFLTAEAGATSSEIYLADYDLLHLRRWTELDEDTPDSLPVDGSEPGNAFVSQTATIAAVTAGVVVYLPISVRAERLGVLAVGLPELPGKDVLAGLQQVSVVLGYVVITAGNHTDSVERARRYRPLALPAEMQWTQLPVRAFSCDLFFIAGQLLPAYEVGGDLFDYAVQPRELTISVMDAMGHGLGASILGTLANGALRNARRTGLALVDQVRSADRVIFGQYGGEQFVTALCLSVEYATGQVRAVNAGHPGLFVLRHDRVDTVELDAQLPLGMFEATAYVEQRFSLHAGDRLVVVSDGVLDGPAHEGGAPYGAQRLEGAILATATASPDEAVRQMVRLLQDYQSTDLRDDATVLILDWCGGDAR